MDNKITALATSNAKQTQSGWVFDVYLIDGTKGSVWSSQNTDIQAFSAVQTGDQVSLTPARKQGKFFFNAIVAKAPAPALPQSGPGAWPGHQPPANPFPQAPAVQVPPAPPPPPPVSEAQKAKEMALVAAACWLLMEEKTRGCPVPPTPKDLMKLVTTMLISVYR